MSHPMPRPGRRLRNELIALVPVLMLPAALALVFPYRAIGHRYVPPRDSVPSCQFVILSRADEAQAKTRLWPASSFRRAQARNLHADLSLSTLPEEPPKNLLTIADCPSFPPSAALPYDGLILPVSLAAEEPGRIAPPPPRKEPLAFSREELLKLD